MTRTLIVILASLILVGTINIEANEFNKSISRDLQSNILNNLQTQAANREKTINYVKNIFLTAKLEAADARKYCQQIHGTIANKNTTFNIESCAAEEKFRIYNKHSISYPAVLNILTQEATELMKLGKEFTQEAVFGRGSIDEVQKYYDRNVKLIINRTDKLLMEDAQRFGEKLAEKEKKEKETGGAVSQDKPKSNTIRSGSAFFVNNTGNILTNAHVINGCTTDPKISYDKKDYNVKIIATDKNLDLALLKVDIKPKNYLNISKNNVNKLDKVFVAGYPLGKALSDDLKFTQGVVSSLKGFQDNSNEIQIDAAINPGSSGGPIVNEAGQLVAIAVSGLSKAQNVNFGIKSTAALGFLNVNSVKVSSGIINLDKNTKNLQKLLEESTVYIYCK